MEERQRRKFRKLFTSQVQRPEAELDLGQAALYLAGEEYPFLDASGYRQQLDALASETRDMAGHATNQRSLIEALSHSMFDQLGFCGNTENYYSVENNFLNRVLDTRAGIPVTLSLIYLELARRLGILCSGVGLPGQFLIRLDALDLYLDPFNKGQLLSAADCRRLVRNTLGPHLPWREEYLAPYSKKDILYRILNNIKGIYLNAGDYRRATSALVRMALISPSSSHLNRDLTWCYFNIHQHPTAIRHLELYVQSAWPSQEASEMHLQIESLWSALTHLNQQSG